jgi:hypothetical protein
MNDKVNALYEKLKANTDLEKSAVASSRSSSTRSQPSSPHTSSRTTRT